MNQDIHPFQSRISYQDQLLLLLEAVIDIYQIGAYHSHAILDTGYEDFNVHLTTNQGEYLLKFFADFRNEANCKRYVDIMTAVVGAGIKHPQLHQSQQGYLTKIKLNDAKIRLVVTDFIEGETFYQLRTKPTLEEQEIIIQQAAKINQLQINPAYVYDSWAVVNFPTEYQNIKDQLTHNDAILIEPVYKDFLKINIKALPKCFVHGDIIDTNVIRATSGEIFILDFSVANVYPRIQELAVILCDLLFDYPNRVGFEQIYNHALEIYQNLVKLTDDELKYLPLFIKAAHAMHIIGASKAKVDGSLSEENNHWIKMGRQGLSFTTNLW